MKMGHVCGKQCEIMSSVLRNIITKKTVLIFRRGEIQKRIIRYHEPS